MSISPSDFAAALPALRPALIQSARTRRLCTQDDAEDLICEVVRLALYILPEFKCETGAPGLQRWLNGILRCVILQDKERAARRVKTVPLATAVNVPAPAPLPSDAQSPFPLPYIPNDQAALVQGWLEGYSQADLARFYCIHRNTVANRLELAFQALRRECPDRDDLTYSDSLLNYCSRVTIYTKPTGVWPSWSQQLPRDFCLTRRRGLPYRRSIGRLSPEIGAGK